MQVETLDPGRIVQARESRVTVVPSDSASSLSLRTLSRVSWPSGLLSLSIVSLKTVAFVADEQAGELEVSASSFRN